MKKTYHAGQLNRVVELYQHTTLTNSSSELVETDVLIGKIWVKRMSTGGNINDEDGRLISISDAKYITRYSTNLMQNGQKYFVRDEDGDYKIQAVDPMDDHVRNRYVLLKCERRGQ